jgi:hypothetical protein
MKIEIAKDFLLIDNKPRFLFGGDFSYLRVPESCWEERLLKLKACGMNTVTFYCPWLCHEPEKGQWNFNGNCNLARFIDLIHQHGLFAILRMGPFVHGEHRNGGLPQWLIDELGERTRTNDPDYLEYARKWYEKLLEIAVPRLCTNGGPIILLQLENELGSAGCKGDDIARGSSDIQENVKHLKYYIDLVKNAGVNVPIIDINKIPEKEKIIPNYIISGGGYPVNCFGTDGDLSPFNTRLWDNHERPNVTIETGSGMFARYYDCPPYRNTNGFQGPLVESELVEALVHQNIAEGANGVNVFVFFDGQEYGPYDESMLSPAGYNFQAPVTCVGSLRDSYKKLKKIGWFTRAFEQSLLRSQPNPGWARAVSYGIPHPGVNTGGDLFEGYGQEREDLDYVSHIKKIDSLARTTTGLNLSESNFLFMRNTKHHGTHWRRDIRVLTNTSRLGAEVNQEYPKKAQMELPPQSNKIMPFFVKLAPKTFLEYSTATLLDKREFDHETTQVIVFASSEEFLEIRITIPEKSKVKTTEKLLASWDTPNSVSIVGKSGNDMQVAIIDGNQKLRYVLMEDQIAGEVWDIEAKDKTVVAASNLKILNSQFKDGKTTLDIETDDKLFYFYLLTPECPKLQGDFIELNEEFNEEFGIFRASGQLNISMPEFNFSHYFDKNNYIWETEIKPEQVDEFYELFLHCEFDGSLGKAYFNEKLISEHSFGKHLFWEIGLKRRVDKPGKLKIIFEESRNAKVTIKPVIKNNLELIW